MPFDAAPVVRSPLPDNIAGQSALVLDMVEFYFRDGSAMGTGLRWNSGERRCLLEAVSSCGTKLGDHRDRAPEYLARAIRPDVPAMSENSGQAFPPFGLAATSTDVISFQRCAAAANILKSPPCCARRRNWPKPMHRVEAACNAT